MQYAAHGLRIFPGRAKPDGHRKAKTPLISDWPKQASCNPEQVKKWWAVWPDALICMPTGQSNGLDVVDIDMKNGKDGGRSMREFQERNGEVLCSLVSITPSGGYHLFFGHRDGIRNSVDQVGTGIDIRGEGGYVILPPSQTDAGCYTWAEPSEPSGNLTSYVSEMPEHLFRAIVEPPVNAMKKPVLEIPSESAANVAQQRGPRRVDWSYIEKAVTAECSKVASCEKGQNDQLNRSAFAISQLVHSYEIWCEGRQLAPREVAEWALQNLHGAAVAMKNLNTEWPWTRSDIESTIQSGWKSGARREHAGSPIDPTATGRSLVSVPATRLPVPSTGGTDELALRAPTPEEAAEIDRACVSNLHGIRPRPQEFAVSAIMPTRVVTLLSGQGGAGKSFIALQAAISVASGRDFFGRATYQGAVVGAFAEDHRDTTQIRLERMTESMGLVLSNFPNLNLVDFTTKNEDPTLFDQNRQHTPGFARVWRHVHRMREACGQVRLVVLDNAALLFGADENARRDVSQFGRLLTTMAAEFDCAVLLLTHVSKGGIQPGHFASGSTAWGNVVRSALTLSRNKDQVLVLSHVKSNLVKLQEPILLEIVDGVPRRLPEGAEQAVAAETEREARKAFIEALSGYEEGQGVSKSKQSSNYAPKLIAKKLGPKFTEKQLAEVMGSMLASDEIVEIVVRRENRSTFKKIVTKEQAMALDRADQEEASEQAPSKPTTDGRPSHEEVSAAPTGS